MQPDFHHAQEDLKERKKKKAVRKSGYRMESDTVPGTWTMQGYREDIFQQTHPGHFTPLLTWGLCLIGGTINLTPACEKLKCLN